MAGLLDDLSAGHYRKAARGLLGPAYEPLAALPGLLGEFSPGADVRDYQDYGSTAIQKALRGDFGQAGMDALWSAAALAGTVLPGSVSGYRKLGWKGPRLTKQEAADERTVARDRRRWPQERKVAFRENRAAVERVQKKRRSAAFLRPNDPLLRPQKDRLENYLWHKVKADVANRYGVSVDDLRSAYKFKGLAGAEDEARRAVQRNHYLALAGNSPLWGKRFADNVRQAVRIEYGVSGAINRANMEAVPRALKKQGWTVRHASKGRSGTMSSRYIVSPDGGFEVRLSDHELPDTPQRQYSREQTGGPQWSDEVVLYGSESPQEVIDDILTRYREFGDEVGELPKDSGNILAGAAGLGLLAPVGAYGISGLLQTDDGT